MFETMLKKIFILLFVSLLGNNLFSQTEGCATQMPAQKMEALRQFQQQLDLGQIPLGKKATKFVPIKIHIIGNNQGLGYYAVSSLLQTLCELNERFTPVGFHFFLADSISYINNDDFYRGDIDAIYTNADGYKLNGAVNVFFHGVGMQWCGVYFGGLDVVFIKNSCQGPNATTLAHELGHFFGLPHTFYGWEGGNTPGEIEKIDLTNCRTAGDGFCDTKADYVSSRWGCPLPYVLKDPNNVLFRPDSSMYMSYSSDYCQSRFSAEQMEAMRADLNTRNIEATSAELSKLPPPQKIGPLPQQKGVNAKYATLQWNKIPGAMAYHVQVARFGDWSILNFDKLVFDTTAVASLFGTWPYAWRVRAITAGNTCSEFGAVDTFETREIPSNLSPVLFDKDGWFFANPIVAGGSLVIQPQGEYDISVWNEWGAKIDIGSGRNNITLNDPGLYFVGIKKQDSFVVKRLIVLQNP